MILRPVSFTSRFFLYLFFNTFLIHVSSSISVPTNSHITSPSGRHQIPESVIRQHFPSTITHPAHDLHKYIYEHDPLSNHLLTSTGRISIADIASRTIQPPLAGRYLVNGAPLHPPHTAGPIIHIGEDYSFVRDYKSGILLSGWGSKLNLKPLDFQSNPSLLVNIHHEEDKLSHASIPQVKHQLTTTNRQFDLQNATNYGQFRPGWKVERYIYFDVGLAFDTSFCSVYASDPANSTSLVHGIGVIAHQMSLTRIVSARMGDIVGFCKAKLNDPTQTDTDVFGPPPPKDIQNCEADPKCTVPELRLHRFRDLWRSFINNSLSDAVYLLTSSKPLRANDIVGAAWVASACSTFGFGWILGNHPVILAHEMGHTLGAPHSDQGLMRPSLALRERSQYIGESLASIENFLSRLSGQACLLARHQGNSDERRFSGFTRIVRGNDGSLLEGTDVATGTVRLEGQVQVIMLHVQKYRFGGVGAEMSMTTLSRSADLGFPFTYNNTYIRQYVKTSHTLNFQGGAGIAIASLRTEKVDDVIVVMLKRNPNRIYYIIGWGIDNDLNSNRVVNNGWSTGRIVPQSFGGDVVALGSEAGRMRDVGEQNDLVIAYIEHNANTSTTTAKYVIGYNINGWSAMARNGWSRPVEIIIPLNLQLPTKRENIGDISVTFWRKPSLDENIPDTLDLLFSFTTRKTSTANWITFVCVAINAHRFRKWNSKPQLQFNCFIPDVGARSVDRLTGGISLTRLLSSSSPVATSVIYQNRQFSSGSSSQWLTVGDGLLTRQQANPAQPKQLALSVGEDIVPVDTCIRCYIANHIPTCKARVNSCFSKRAFGKLEKVLAKSLVRQQQPAAGQIFPKTDAIFCAGFHSIFVLQSNSQSNELAKCGWDSKRTSIIAEGVRSILLQDVDLQEKSSQFEGTVSIVQGLIPDDLQYILGSGGFSSGFIPTSISVTVYSSKFIRWIIVSNALKKVRKRADFASFFSNTRQAAKIVRKGSKKFVVTIKFKQEYQLELLKNIAAGRAHDGRR